MSIFDSNPLGEAFEFLNQKFKCALSSLSLLKTNVLLQFSFVIPMQVIVILHFKNLSFPPYQIKKCGSY